MCPIVSILDCFGADLACELWGTWHELPRRAEGQGSGQQGQPLLWVTNSCWLRWEVLSGVSPQLKQPVSSEVKQEPCPHCLTEPQMRLQHSRAEMNFCTRQRNSVCNRYSEGSMRQPPWDIKIVSSCSQLEEFFCSFFSEPMHSKCEFKHPVSEGIRVFLKNQNMLQLSLYNYFVLPSKI